MRKKLALYGIVVVLVAFAASTLASAQTRSAVVADGERSVKAADSSQRTLTIQRLLQSRLRWTRQLAKALRFLDLPPAPPTNGTNTIIDEPDPAGYGDQREEGESEEEGPPDHVEDDDGPHTVQLGAY